MTIKYEPVFGDQSLFEGMPSDCEFISGAYGYKVKNDSLFYCEKYNPKYGWACACVDTSDFKPDAARRVIKMPTWTRADQEAGVLPPVGCKYLAGSDNLELECLYNDATGNVWGFDSEGAVSGYALGYCRPIETPAEKAQREEDEFVESTCRQNEPHSTLYSDGARAAYRKLKGGE